VKYLLIPILFALPAIAADYYVDADNGADGNIGTSTGAAWQTLGKASGEVGDGDTVYLRGTTWSNEQFSFDGANPVSGAVLRAYAEETPIIGWKEFPIVFQNETNCSIIGVTITNAGNGVYIRECSGILVSGCTVAGCTNEVYGAARGYGLVTLNSVTYLHVTNCTFQNNGWVDDSDSQDIGGGLTLAAGCNKAVVEDSVFIHGGHHALQINSSNSVVRNNTIYNDNWTVWTNGVALTGNRCLELRGSKRNLVENNVIGYTGYPPDNVDKFGEVVYAPDETNAVHGIEVEDQDNIIRYNTIHTMRGSGIAAYGKSGNLSTNTHAYNNTLLNCGYDPIIRPNERHPIFAAGAADTNSYWVNNLFYVVGSVDGYIMGGPGGSNTARWAGNYENIGDPKLTNTNAPGESNFTLPDVTLLSSSPCIDAGAWLTTASGAGSGATTVTVTDASYFYDGWGIPGETGDSIQFEGQSTTYTVSDVDYDNNQLILSSAATWGDGDGVALPYSGDAPDQGAYEWNGYWTQTHNPAKASAGGDGTRWGAIE